MVRGRSTSPSIFFAGMAGSRMPIAVAHGEGRAEFARRRRSSRAGAALVAARFVDNRGAADRALPAQPERLARGITALHHAPTAASPILMPHPERVFRTVQMCWHPREWGEDSPWMRMFRNARAFVG